MFIDFAGVAGDGALYFMRWDAPNRTMQLWRSSYRGGDYDQSQRVQLGDPSVSIHDPAAPDQSLIVFDYGKVTGELGRLSIAFRLGRRWGAPFDLGDQTKADLS